MNKYKENDVLTAQGRAWLDRLNFTEEERAKIFSSMTQGGAQSYLEYQCGGRILHAAQMQSAPQILAAILSELYCGGDRASLFIVTFNELQEAKIELFKAAGFSNQTAWVQNPNSGYKICCMTTVVPPEYVQGAAYEEPEEDDWDEGDDY